MIARVDTPRRKQRFLRACRGAVCLETILPLDLALFGRSQPHRFFCGPTLALELEGRTAFAAGHANPEELASFLRFCGVERLTASGPAPAGWELCERIFCFELGPGQALPLPKAEEELWAQLQKEAEPSPGAAARLICSQQGGNWEDRYSELCTKLARNRARLWGLTRGGELVSTVGAYALAPGQAYLASGVTAGPLRGKGIGGRLIVGAANALAGEGYRVRLLCTAQRAGFYTRLGFAPAGGLGQYAPAESIKE